jgi:hypothetical protein
MPSSEDRALRRNYGLSDPRKGVMLLSSFRREYIQISSRIPI